MHSPPPAAPAELPGLYDFQPRTRIIGGAGVLGRLGTLAGELGARHALLVTDRGIVAAGHAQAAVLSLENAGLQVTLFAEVQENPTTRDVNHCLEAARKAGIDLFVGLGGGSSMDTAKGCNFLLTNGGEMKDYWGVGKASRPMLPLIAVPTTSGTGSECQSAALIADEASHQKMACLDPKAAAAIALLDPLLTLSQPLRVTACTGMDALAHALESAVTGKRNRISALFAREAFALCLRSLPRVLRDGHDLEGRAEMQLGAALAGLAIEYSMLGAAHSAANPLTAHHGIVHGQAVGLMLPGIVRFNAEDDDARAIYCELARIVGLASADALGLRIAELLDDAGLRGNLASFGVRRENLPALAEEASRQWTAQFNPRPIGQEDFARLYEEILT